MSKKDRTGKTDDIFKNIGERMKKNRQTKEETDPPEEEIAEEKTTEEETAATEPTDNKEEKKETKESNDLKSSSWNEEQSYRSSFIVTGEMEDDFEACRRKFRKNLRSTLSKQSAIELGWKLLNSLDQKYFEEVKATHSPDDDLIQALKEVIDEHY